MAIKKRSQKKLSLLPYLLLTLISLFVLVLTFRLAQKNTNLQKKAAEIIETIFIFKSPNPPPPSPGPPRF
ncbi:MAG: hypothetical protein WC686_05335 [Candidatus Shapirobacteria bacterium]|jgi:hypothetical protein